MLLKVGRAEDHQKRAHGGVRKNISDLGGGFPGGRIRVIRQVGKNAALHKGSLFPVIWETEGREGSAKGSVPRAREDSSAVGEPLSAEDLLPTD